MSAEILGQLRALFERNDPIPGHVLESACRASSVGGAFRGRETQQLHLIGDSANSDSSLRGWGDTADERALTFAVSGRLVEAELTPENERRLCVRGLVLGKGRRTGPIRSIELRHPAGSCRSAVDEDGQFRVEHVPKGPLSFVLHGDGSVTAVADWLVC